VTPIWALKRLWPNSSNVAEADAIDQDFDEIALVRLKYKADVECPDMIWPH
jgi:hypothetical protein